MPLEATAMMSGVAESREHSLVQRLLSAQAFWVTIALLIMSGVMSVLQPDAFASTENFYNITRNFAFIGIMALGMTTVIVTGGIDLSVGSVPASYCRTQARGGSRCARVSPPDSSSVR
jgi:ribose transport system permease protein